MRIFAFALVAFVGAATPAWSETTRESSEKAPYLTTDTFVNLAEQIVPSVVNISTTMTVKSPFPQGLPEDFFHDFFGENGPRGGFGFHGPRGSEKGPKVKATALGSGFIIDPSGIILTNNHVVSNADEIKIQFTEEANEKPVTAKVIGRDPDLDIALVKVNEKRKMIPLKLGNSDKLKVGDFVMAVGNPFGQGHSASHGIISGKGRNNPDFPLTTYLQTDAPINPGNSGGPLVNLKGEVIGINTAIQAHATGIGFAVPMSLVSQVLPQLRTTGSVQRGYLGLMIEPLSDEVASELSAPKDLQAPFVANVAPGGPAEKAGVKNYDIVTEIGGHKVTSPADLTSKVVQYKPGDKVPLKVLRDGKEKTIEVKLGRRPSLEMAENEQKPEESKSKTGLSLQNLTPEVAQDIGVKPGKGVVVTDVDPGSPAEKAGLSAGDVIVEVNKKPVKDVHDFLAEVGKGDKRDLLRVEHPQVSPDAFSVAVLDMSKK